jgi:serine/threonine kinase PknH
MMSATTASATTVSATTVSATTASATTVSATTGALPWTQPPPWTPPSRASRKPWLILGAAAATAVALAATAIWLATHNTSRQPLATVKPTTTTTTVPTIAATQLDSILLTGKEIDTIMDASNMQAGPAIPTLDPIDATLTLSNPDCLGALFPGQTAVYADSGYAALRSQALNDGANHYVEQVVIAFSTADQASALVRRSAVTWNACARQTVSQSRGGTQVKTALGDVTGSPPKIGQVDLEENNNGESNGYACQRALSAVSNLVFDIGACGRHLTDDASRMADAMAAKATK